MSRLGVVESVEDVAGSQEEKEDEEKNIETGSGLVSRDTSVHERAIDSFGVVHVCTSFNKQDDGGNLLTNSTKGFKESVE